MAMTPEQREKQLAYGREWREKNADRYRQWFEENRAHLAAYAREYRKRRKATDPAYVEQQRAMRTAYYEQNKEQIRKYISEWRKQHPDFTRRKHGRRKAREYNAPQNDLTVTQWQQVVESYGGRCAYCGCVPERMTMDHVTPLACGGSHTVSNVVPACHPCNSRKSDSLDWKPMTPEEAQGCST
jgi:5-methylcytosine-specific restriction endonuclease McrA